MSSTTGKIRKAKRTFRFLKVGVGGVSSSGKTWGSLKMAYGITKDWNKICVIDSENNSADLYAHFGDYYVYPLNSYSPQSYIQAITEVVSTGQYQVVIIDSLSHEWSGPGGMLEYVDRISHTSNNANSFAAWGKANPVHQAFVDAWLKCPCHIIATLRSKDEYVIEKNEKGKNVPRKVGMKNIQRDQLDYEFDILFRLEKNHYASVEKTRANIFTEEFFYLDETIGAKLIEWASIDDTSSKKEKKPIKSNEMYDRLMNMSENIKDEETRENAQVQIEKHKNNKVVLAQFEKRINEIMKEEAGNE